MRDKMRLLIALAISLSVLLIVLSISLYSHLKKVELEHNERKATLIKDNLNLKDEIEELKSDVEIEKKSYCIIKEESDALREQLAKFETEKDIINKASVRELEELREKNDSLLNKIEDLQKKSLIEHIKEASRREDKNNLKKYLAKVVKNIEIIKRGGDIELDPIIVSKKQDQGKKEVAIEIRNGPIKVSIETKGNVVSVDGKYSLVVLDRGRKDGIDKGRQCSIMRNNKEIAFGEIINTRYKVSAAFIYEMAYGYKVRDIKKGDSVVIVEQ